MWADSKPASSEVLLGVRESLVANKEQLTLKMFLPIVELKFRCHCTSVFYLAAHVDFMSYECVPMRAFIYVGLCVCHRSKTLPWGIRNKNLKLGGSFWVYKEKCLSWSLCRLHCVKANTRSSQHVGTVRAGGWHFKYQRHLLGPLMVPVEQLHQGRCD